MNALRAKFLVALLFSASAAVVLIIGGCQPSQPSATDRAGDGRVGSVQTPATPPKPPPPPGLRPPVPATTIASPPVSSHLSPGMSPATLEEIKARTRSKEAGIRRRMSEVLHIPDSQLTEDALGSVKHVPQHLKVPGGSQHQGSSSADRQFQLRGQIGGHEVIMSHDKAMKKGP